MNRFWKWFGRLSFMQDTTPLEPEKSEEEALGIAVLAIVDKYNLQPGQGFRGDCFAIPGYESVPPIHFVIEVCHQPEVCFAVPTEITVQ